MKVLANNQFVTSRGSSFVRFFTLLALVVTLVGCDSKGKTIGAAIPADAAAATLSGVLSDPAAFHEKKVVLRGLIQGQCASLCEFTFSEGTQSVLIFPLGFSLPRLPVGKPVTVYAQVTAGSGQTVLSALGLQIN